MDKRTWWFSLLCKFPALDPSWAPEVQAGWWRCWHRLSREFRAFDAGLPQTAVPTAGADGDTLEGER